VWIALGALCRSTTIDWAHVARANMRIGNNGDALTIAQSDSFNRFLSILMNSST
jgi:hypothetical protein